MRARRLVLAVACVGLIGAPPAAQAASAEDATLHRYGAATWQSFAAMTDEDSGLPADTLHYDGTRSVQTSTTSIGAYMWSALVAEELGVISHAEVVERLGTRALAAVGGVPDVGVPVVSIDEAIGRGHGDMRTPLDLQSLSDDGRAFRVPDGAWALTPEGIAWLAEDRALSDR